MTDSTTPQATPDGVPAPPPDDENQALIDALKTFRIAMWCAASFCASSLVIVLMTRMG